MPRTKKVLPEDSQLDGEKLEDMKKRQRLLEAQKARERRANQSPEEIAGRRAK